MAGVPTIPGWNNPRVEFTKVTESNRCCKCDRMLYQPMQTECGHQLCSPCLSEILASSNDANCPGKDETCVAINRYNVYPDFATFREMSKMEVYCPNKDIGCPEKFRFTEVQNHLEKCQYKKLACTVEGCKFQGSASNLKDHLASAAADHVILLNQTVKDSIRSLQEKNLKLEEERRDEHRLEVEALKARIDQLETIVREQREASPNDIAQIQRRMEGQTIVREQMEASANTLAKVKGQMEEQRSALQRLSIQVERNNKLIQMNNNSRTTGIHVSATQNTVYHTAYHWQITNYFQKKQNEISGLTQFHDSEPFYCGGYKMCMRIYLFGDGIGKGSHISLYLSILRGENDDTLKWPFSHRISMVLLNPSLNPQDLDQKVVQEQFDPVATSGSYHKPKSARNKGTGSPLFAPHSVAESPECLVDNTLHILMHVNSSILEPVR